MIPRWVHAPWFILGVMTMAYSIARWGSAPFHEHYLTAISWVMLCLWVHAAHTKRIH